MLEVSIREVCPHCKGWSHLRLILKHSYDEELGNAWDHEDITSSDLAVYFVFMCANCENLILYYWDEPIMYRLVEVEQIFNEDVREELLQEDDDLSVPYIVWPPYGDGRSLSDFVPQQVKQLYQVALNVKNSDPNLFAVQIRRALEVICLERDARRDKLWKMLEELSNRGILPPTLAEIARELKDTGNKGAHADSIGVRREDAEAIDEFFRMIVNYVYDAPAKLNEFRKLLPELIQESDDATIH